MVLIGTAAKPHETVSFPHTREGPSFGHADSSPHAGVCTVYTPKLQQAKLLRWNSQYILPIREESVGVIRGVQYRQAGLKLPYLLHPTCTAVQHNTAHYLDKSILAWIA